MEKELMNYLMLPQNINDTIEIYPVRLKDWEEFHNVSGVLYTHGKKNLKNLYHYEGEYILDFLINKDSPLVLFKEIEDQTEVVSNNCIDEKQIKLLKTMTEKTKKDMKLEFTIEDIERNFEIITRNKVRFEYIKTEDSFEYAFKIGDTGKSINKYNFDKVRDLVMEQNIIFEPVTSPSPSVNNMFREVIEYKNSKGVKTSLTSMISVVSIHENKNTEEILNMTYYRLRYDYEIINREHSNLIKSNILTNGGKVTIDPLCKEVEMYDNPYSLDKLTKEVTKSGENKKQKL